MGDRKRKGEGTYKVETINVSLLNPLLEDIGDLLRVTDNGGAETANGDVLGDGDLGPLGDAGGGAGPHLDGRADGVALDLAELLVIAILVEIDTGPASKESKGAFDAAVLGVVLELLGGGLGGLSQDGGHEGEELDVLGVAAVNVTGHVADFLDRLGDGLGREAGDEDALGVLGGELLAALGGAGLQEDGGALGRGLADMGAGHLVILALVVDLADAAGLGVDTALGIEHDGIVAPRRVPQLVHDLQVLLGHGVALIVAQVAAAEAEVAGGGVEVAGDDVPADTTLGQVVEGRQAAGKVVGLLVGGGNGDTECEVLGGGGHGGHNERGLVDGPLSARDGGRLDVARSLVDIVAAEHVGDEHAMELALLEELGELYPALNVVELGRLVVRVAPEAWKRGPGSVCAPLTGGRKGASKQSCDKNLPGAWWPEQFSTKALRMSCFLALGAWVSAGALDIVDNAEFGYQKR